MKTGFQTAKLNGWTIAIDSSLDRDGFMERCLCEDKSQNPLFEAVTCSKSTRVFRFEWAGQAYYYKEYLFRNPRKHLKILRRGRDLVCIAGLLGEAGFKTPRIICYGRKGLRIFVVSEAADADASVYDVLMEKSGTPILDLQRFKFLFGEEIGRLHSAGFVHGDLRWGNILVRDAETDCPKFVFIDNDRTKKYKSIPPRLRVKNLVQIKYPGSLLDKPESDWDAVWEGYVAGNPDMQNCADALRRRVDARNAKRVAAWWKKPRNRHLLKHRKAGVTANEA
jgi:tRNA A-37 threonylcarbamoyl transferase component Bud32